MNSERWTMHDKKKLIRLINTYGIDDYKGIAKKMPNKSEQDVYTFLKAEKRKAKKKIQLEDAQNEQNSTAPKEEDLPAIDQWIKITSGLVNKETLDFSSHLARVMLIIADYENFPEPDLAASIPDYRAIYRYLGALLAGKESPGLRPLESAVVLEILHSLLEVLGTADINVQRQVMKWKYQLITAQKTDSRNKTKYSRKVIENDFTEFITEQDELTDSDSDVELATTTGKSKGKSKVGHANVRNPNSVYPVALYARADSQHKESSVNKTAKRRKLDTAEKDERNSSVSEGTSTGRNSGVPNSTSAGRNSGVSEITSAGGTMVRVENQSDLTNGINKSPNKIAAAKYIKRREFTYRPPVIGPQVVLVMPPKDKPIIQPTVKERIYHGTADGKYKPLGKVTEGVCDKIKSSILKQTSLLEETSNLSHKEILSKLNAKVKNANFQREEIKKENVSATVNTSAQEIEGNIHVRLVAEDKTLLSAAALPAVENISKKINDTFLNDDRLVMVKRFDNSAVQKNAYTPMADSLTAKETSQMNAYTPMAASFTAEETVQVNAYTPMTGSLTNEETVQVNSYTPVTGSLSAEETVQVNAHTPMTGPLMAEETVQVNAYTPMTGSLSAKETVQINAYTPMEGSFTAEETSTEQDKSQLQTGDLKIQADTPTERNDSFAVSADTSSTEMEREYVEPEFSAIPLSMVNDTEQCELSIRTAKPSGSERKPKKRKAFDKSRYTAFVKSDPTSKQPEKLPKKPKLYSLNPFCVPISLLDVLK